MNDNNYNLVSDNGTTGIGTNGNDNTHQSPSQNQKKKGSMSILTKLLPSPRSSRRSNNNNNLKTNSAPNYKPPAPPHTALANHQQPNRTSLFTITNNNNKDPRKERKKQQKHHLKNIKRYRGFSTSISSLFLDEQVVCGALSWCGLLASSRTEYLLQVRDEQLHKKGERKHVMQEMPSRVLGFSLILTIVFLTLTYLIWGFGDVNEMNEQEFHYKYYGRRVRSLGFERSRSMSRYDIAKKYYVPGVMRIYDYDQRFWSPTNALIWKMVPQTKTSSSLYISSSSSSSDRHLYYNYDSNYTFYYTDNNNNEYTSWVDDQDLAANLRLVVCLIFFVILGLFGRRRRMKTRFAVLKARAQDDKLHFGASTLQLEDKYSGACSHTLCGCYPVDRKVIRSSKNGDELDNDNNDSDIIAPGIQKSQQDCINSTFTIFMNCCCGKLCQLWCQCFSTCALAQEAREVRLLIPPKLQRVDFITHQSWDEYFKEIYKLRLSWKEKHNGVRRSYGSHFRALSLLSRSILVTFTMATIVIILTEQFNPRAIFSWADACVLLSTFAQSFIVLGIVHGMFHKSDLSLDAVIKFFAAGFIIATPTAFVFEYIFMTILASVYYVCVAIMKVFDREFDNDFSDIDSRILIVLDFVQAFFIAALVEEICKYYAFRTVEHPDLIFLTGLNRVKRDKMTTYGGNSDYAFSSDNNALISRNNDAFESQYSNDQSNGKRNYRGRSLSPTSLLCKMMNRGEDKADIDVRTARQKAAAVTTAMISGAVGLACAENFMYVFFFSGSNTQDEIAMLLLRSIFPIHALCAAMQSIGVIEKFLEEINDSSKRIGVGRIILPGLLLHGSFDATLMTINSIIDSAIENVEERGGGDVDANFMLLDIIAGVTVLGVMFSGLVWYYIKNRAQKAKLKLLEPGQNLSYSSEIESGLELL